MYHIIYLILFLVSAYIWGDWKNWKIYYSDILFFISVNLLYKLLFYNYPLWLLEPIKGTEQILSNSTFIVIAQAFIIYPATILIFFRNYPKGKKQIPYLGLWVAIYIIFETVLIQQKGISYHNGWHLGWTFIFDIAMFLLLRLHHQRPLWAWLISFILIISTSLFFGLPISSID